MDFRKIRIENSKENNHLLFFMTVIFSLRIIKIRDTMIPEVLNKNEEY